MPGPFSKCEVMYSLKSFLLFMILHVSLDPATILGMLTVSQSLTGTLMPLPTSTVEDSLVSWFYGFVLMLSVRSA